MHQVVPYNSAWLMLQSWPESFRNVQPLLTLSQPIHVLYVMSERIRDYLGGVNRHQGYYSRDLFYVYPIDSCLIDRKVMIFTTHNFLFSGWECFLIAFNLLTVFSNR